MDNPTRRARRAVPANRPLVLAAGLAMGALQLAAEHAMAQGDPLADPFPAVLELGSLDGVIGFRMDGRFGSASARSVSGAGDLNGDGFDDVAIGANFDVLLGRTDSGVTYVVFGRDAAASWPAELELADVNGINGFKIVGAETESSGCSVAPAGDVNGDGIADLVIGAYWSSAGGAYQAGAAYVLFGRDTASGTPFPPVVDLTLLDGTDGFRIDGVASYDRCGEVVASAGDVNGDGVDDVVIGASAASPSGRAYAGQAYVVYGRRSGFPSSLPLASLAASDGFRIDGAAASDFCGRSLGAAGDLNADGVDDLAIGSPFARANAGTTHVIFGRRSGFPTLIDLSVTAPGRVRIDGTATFDRSGSSIASAGDFNGDGVDDLAIGSPGADPGGRSYAGAVAVVFGRTTAFPLTFRLADLDASSGLWLHGVRNGDGAGGAVAGGDDVNGDGAGDIVIGAAGADPGGRVGAGETYVVYGRDGSSAFPSSMELAELGDANGFRIEGIAAGDASGSPVAMAGDMNGDGAGDLVIGSPGAEPGGYESGQSYVVFGRRPAATCPADLDGDGELTIFDFLAFQNFFDAMDPVADFDGDGAFTIFDFLAFQNAFDAGCP